MPILIDFYTCISIASCYSTCNYLFSVLALELREDRAQYEAKARELTRKFASIDRFEVRKVRLRFHDCIQSVDWTSGLDYWSDQFS